MNLVRWSEGLDRGIGRSGTRYAIHFTPEPVTDAPFNCLIAVDDQEVCAVDSLEAAVGRIEHLEALRCFLGGLAGELSDDQLDQAAAVAAEMAEVAEESLDRPDLSCEQRRTVAESAAALTAIRHRILAAGDLRRRGLDGSVTLH